eukprot:scaffold6434_cov21-Prasinocladus_malaysianus.AAC.1
MPMGVVMVVYCHPFRYVDVFIILAHANLLALIRAKFRDLTCSPFCVQQDSFLSNFPPPPYIRMHNLLVHKRTRLPCHQH